MADTKSTGGRKPLPRKPQPKASTLFDEAFEPVSVAAAPAALSPVPVKRKQPSWLKQNAILATGMSVVGFLLVLILVMGWQLGWFGGSTPAPMAKKQGTTPQTARTRNVPLESKTGTPAASTAVVSTKGAVPVAASKPAQQQPAPTAKQESPKAATPAKPPLPDDFKKWRRDDWTRARQENHPKLCEGVVYLGETFHSTPVAQGLTGLLKPLPREKSADKPAAATPSPAATIPDKLGRGTFGPPSFSKEPAKSPATATPAPGAGTPVAGVPASPAALVDAIITALVKNGSDVAMKTVREVLAGRLPTEDDKAAVESALQALLAHPSADNEALLARLVVNPEAIRSAEHEGAWPAKDLRAKAFDLAKLSQSSKLRTAMGKAATERSGIIDADDPVHKFLLEDNPLNCGAQILFYQKTKQELRSKLERQLLDYSSLTMARYLGVPDPARNGAGSGAIVMPTIPRGDLGGLRVPSIGGTFEPQKPSAEPAAGRSQKSPTVDLAAELAGQLWTKDFLRLFESELGRSSLEKQAQLLLLASTIPCESPRSLVIKALSKRVNAKTSEEPTPLETAGMIDKVVTDPALLVAIKTLRKDAGSSRPGRPGGDKSRVSDAAKKKQDADKKWLDVSQKMVEAWCKRFAAAAQAKDDKKTGATDAAAPTLPAGWKLGSDATVKAAYHVAWPEQAPPQLAKLEPAFLEVHYLRIEENGKPKRVTDFYRGQAGAKATDVRSLDKCTWIDKIGLVPSQKDRRRSVDVLIANPQGSPAGAAPTLGMKPERAKPEAEVDLVIEVLVIEVNEPDKE